MGPFLARVAVSPKASLEAPDSVTLKGGFKKDSYSDSQFAWHLHADPLHWSLVL